MTRRITLVDIGNPLAIYGVLPNVLLGDAYSALLYARGGRAPYTYTVIAGALPTGLQLDPATGEVSGTPSAGGSFPFTVQATDNSGRTVRRSYVITVVAAAQVNMLNLLHEPGPVYGDGLAAATVPDTYGDMTAFEVTSLHGVAWNDASPTITFSVPIRKVARPLSGTNFHLLFLASMDGIPAGSWGDDNNSSSLAFSFDIDGVFTSSDNWYLDSGGYYIDSTNFYFLEPFNAFYPPLKAKPDFDNGTLHMSITLDTSPYGNRATGTIAKAYVVVDTGGD